MRSTEERFRIKGAELEKRAQGWPEELVPASRLVFRVDPKKPNPRLGPSNPRP